jgi:uncharacterized membrane protein YebE (DUF533 family)
MLNPEKLLGGLLGSGIGGRRRRGLGSLLSGGAALGLVGVAMEAVEHFMNQKNAPVPPGPPPAGTQMAGGAMPPPPPSRSGPGTVPPPPPGRQTQLKTGADRNQQSNAVLLIRAMIAAANADGVIDAQERGRILDKLKTVSLSQEEHEFIVHELLEPKDMAGIVAEVTSDELAQQVYAVSLMAIDVDTDAERDYLHDLAQQLGLDEATTKDIQARMGL